MKSVLEDKDALQSGDRSRMFQTANTDKYTKVGKHTLSSGVEKCCGI